MDNSFETEIKGLRNFGNTCYFNSAIQLLMKLPTFDNNIESQDIVITLMKKVNDSYKYNDGSLEDNLRNLYIAVCREKGYPLGSQQDSCEFVQFILDKITDFTPYKNDVVIMMNQLLTCNGNGTDNEICNNPYKICQSQKESILISNAINDAQNQNIEINFKTFLEHSLQISKCELKDYKCNCDEPKHIVQTVLTALPKYLFINVGRGFAFSQKKMNILTIADNFKLSTPVNLKDLCENINRNITEHIYKLHGIIIHYGASLHSGHYMSYIKKNNKWHICNDDIVVELDNFSNKVVDVQRNTCVLLYIRE